MSDDLSKQLIQLLGGLESLPNGIAATRFFVNRMPALIETDEVVAWEDGNTPVALSDVKTVDAKIPHIQRLIVLYRSHLLAINEAGALAEDVYRPDINELPNHAVWLPYRFRQGGVLLLRSSRAFSNAEVAVAKMCVSNLAALSGTRETPVSGRILRAVFTRGALISFLVFSLLLAALTLISVPNMVLVSAELASSSKSTVRPAVSGTIASMETQNGKFVQKDDILFILDTEQISAKIKIARAESDQLAAEYQQAALTSLKDVQARFKMSSLRGELEQKNNQIAFLEGQKNSHIIKAPRSGVVDLGAVEDFVGLPVDLGHQLATIVDPDKIELSMQMNVATSTDVKIGDVTTFFPYSRPWSTLHATVNRISITPDLDLSGNPIYRIYGVFDADSASTSKLLGIGEAGRARIDSAPVALGFYLLRRPLGWLRRMSGY